MFVVLDIDECGASSPVCDINANCSNTRGSYICTCKLGYTGDGKMCQGIINVVLPCDNNGDGRFPGTCNDHSKSAIHRIQSVYIPAVHDIICLGLYLRENWEIYEKRWKVLTRTPVEEIQTVFNGDRKRLNIFIIIISFYFVCEEPTIDPCGTPIFLFF